MNSINIPIQKTYIHKKTPLYLTILYWIKDLKKKTKKRRKKRYPTKINTV